MNKQLISLLLFLVTCIITSCTKEDVLHGSFDIEEINLHQEFTQEKSTAIIPVSTTLSSDDWSVVSNADWCVASQGSGGKNIQVLVLKNEDPDIRATTLTIKTPLKNLEIKITQIGHDKVILLNPEKVEASPDGEEVLVRATSNIEYNLLIPKEATWVTQIQTRSMVERVFSFKVEPNQTYTERTAEITFVGKNDTTIKSKCIIHQSGKEGKISDIPLEGDIQIRPIGGVASENQPGQGIDKCYDGIIGKDNGFYHSVWSQSAKFPVSLEFNFDGKNEIDYFIYHTRSGNGNFGVVKVYTATSADPQYKLEGTYDFNMQNAASKRKFSVGVKATKIKFEVYSGAGNFVSCDEMQFFKTNQEKSLDASLLTVFTDLSCSSLRSGVTDAQMNALPSYFAQLAYTLKNDLYDSYEKQFRIRDYDAYSNVEDWADKLMTKKYGNLDNCTGIYANAGDSIVVLVGDTHGNSISLQVVEETGPGGDTYFLEKGVNKIGIRKSGMLFIMYTANITASTAKPIRIHIPPKSGRVNGFFDLKEHKTDAKYAEILSKATWKYFFVRGEKMIFYFHLNKMKEVCPNNILSAINLWDNIVGWEQELMGVDGIIPEQMNNHIFAMSPEDGYMWASDYRIGFVYTYLNNILLKERVMAAKDNAWGPGHEIGHIHQAAINWPSTTESSNNLFSNYVLYKLGKYGSRGSELSQLAMNRYEFNRAWCNFGGGEGEDTELHMRMNWQLWNYYHRCGFKTNFFQTLFKLLRSDRIVESNPGAAQLKFAMNACKAANENLTEFFDAWGFFIPVNTTISQYGTWKYVVTQEMIDDAKAYMATFPTKAAPIQYIEDRTSDDFDIGNYKVGELGYYTQFKNKVTINKVVSYQRNGQRVTVTNGEQAVAFEVYSNSRVVYFSNFTTFDVPSSISLNGSTIYAVQSGGKRVSMENKSMSARKASTARAKR